MSITPRLSGPWAAKLPSRIPSLDGLRAISILLVILGHSVSKLSHPKVYQLLGHFGNLGVKTFFLISGFLITTLLLNFVGVLLIYYVATGPWLDPSGVSFASTARLPHDVPSFWGDVHWGLPLAILLTIAVAAVLNFTRWGYEVRIAGSNPNAARYAAIPFRRHLIVVMLMSGAIAGLAGMLEAAGTAHRLQGGISNNFGYIGIMVAVLARGSAIGVIAGAVLMAIILKSGISLQTQGVNISTVLAITGLILFFTALADELSHYRIVRTKEA